MDRKNLPSYYTQEDLKVIKLFKEEMDRINLLYMKAVQSNDITKANQLYKKIQNIADTLTKRYGERADIKIPNEYLKGVSYIDSVDGTNTISVSSLLDKGEIESILGELGPIHIEAVNALLNNSKNYVNSSLDGMKRQALTMITEIQQEKVREELAKGTIEGDSIFNMRKKVEQYFKENNITHFKDRGGKSWSMDRYIDLLTRTETSIANIQGTINRGLEVGITKFKVIEQPDCCKDCENHDGKIVDISEGAVDLPPFHPNCRGFIIAVDDTWGEEPREKLNIPKQVYDYLKRDIKAVKKKRDGNYPIGLVNEAIVRNYSGGSFKSLNKWRGNDWVKRKLNNIIKANKDYDGIVYRGMSFTEEEWTKYLKTGKIYHSGFMSTSLNESKAEKICNALAYKDKPIKVVFELRGRGGMDIHNYSKVEGQQEILFQMGKTLTFDASSIKSDGKYLRIKGKINGQR